MLCAVVVCLVVLHDVVCSSGTSLYSAAGGAIDTVNLGGSLPNVKRSFCCVALWHCPSGTSLWSAAGGAIDTVNLVRWSSTGKLMKAKHTPHLDIRAVWTQVRGCNGFEGEGESIHAVWLFMHLSRMSCDELMNGPGCMCKTALLKSPHLCSPTHPYLHLPPPPLPPPPFPFHALACSPPPCSPQAQGTPVRR
jgi:hypothetical protein